jgi:CRISPR-associated endonuclease Cas1
MSEPPASPPPPARIGLHLLVDDGLVALDEGRLSISTTDGSVRYVPLSTLAGVSIHGHAGMTTPALRALLAEGVPVVWRDPAGKVIGILADGSLRVSRTHRAQYAAQADTAVCLALANGLVAAKIVQSRALLSRRGAAGCDELAILAARALVAPDRAALLGVEGAAARLFFSTLPDLIDPASGFEFTARRRRPAPDPVNAMLSYAYAIVAGEAMAAALAAALDPDAGFLHVERAGRPALALDLMEPLRPLVAERAVLRAVNRGMVKPSGFVDDGDGVRMNDPTRRTLIRLVEDRLGEPAPCGDLDIRSALRADALSLASSLRAGRPFVSRFAGG